MKLNCILLSLLLSCSASAGALGAQVFGDASDILTERLKQYDDLLRKAESDGQVRVIIRVDAAFVPEGKLREKSTIEKQRLDITQAQHRVLQDLSGFDFSHVRQFKYIPYMAMEVHARTLRVLLASPQVRGLEEDAAEQPALADTIFHVGATNARSMGYSGDGQAIVIIDTGVDNTHAFFEASPTSGNNIIEEACFSTNGSANNSLCPNGGDTQFGAGAATPCTVEALCGVNPTQSCSDPAVLTCGHGTHVAGIAAGANWSGPGGSPTPPFGIASDASIIAVQVLSKSGSGTTTLVSDQLAALEWVLEKHNDPNFYADHGIDGIAAVNMSLGDGQNWVIPCDGSSSGSARKAAIDNLRAVGIATVVASGNQGYPTGMNAPACISTAISVGSSTKPASGQPEIVSVFSNVANDLDFLAPGGKTPFDGSTPQYPEDIMSSVPLSLTGTYFTSLRGTSMATPHVAGAWAILKHAKPEASVDEVLNALTVTGVPITSAAGIIKPRIQIDTALNYLLSHCNPPASGDWIVSSDCTFEGTSTAPANILVEAGVALTIASGSILQIDFSNYHLLVKSAAKVVVESGARLD